MGIQKFQVVFDRSSKRFESNQNVTGKILLSLNAPKKMRAVMVHFKGEASIKWDETEESKNNEGNTVYKTIEYTGNEVYFENKFNLAGGPSGVMTLQTGDYCYSFNTVLPPNLPSSFEGKFGHVRYTLKAIIDCPEETNSETHETFTVICPLDLKKLENVKVPVKETEEHFFCCCCCKSGPLTVVASLPARGFVSGQELPVTVEVDNISQEEISGVSATLYQHITFYAKSPCNSHNSEKTKITTINLGSVGQNGSETWTKNISIPLLPASNLECCSLIDIKYELQIVAEVAAMCSSNVYIKIPVTVGTIPLEGVHVADEFIIGNISEPNVETGSNFNTLETAQGVAPSYVGFQIPPSGGMPMPGQPQPVFPPPYPTPGMQPSVYTQPNMGMQPNMGQQPGMPHYMGVQPGMQSNAYVMQPQIDVPYNPQVGNFGQPNVGVPALPPQNIPYQGVPAGVHGQPIQDFTQNSYQNASAPSAPTL